MRRAPFWVSLLTLYSTATAMGSICGNGVPEPGEPCDGETVACGELASSYASDSQLAACRSDCLGFDVSACTIVNDGDVEMVKPRARQQSAFRHARCNTGTPFGFEIAVAPPGGQRNTWAIVLQGGGDCDDFSLDCSRRGGPLIHGPAGADKKRGAPSSRFAGLLAPDPVNNPRFFDGHRVFAWYCSSDMWTGSGTTATIPTTGGEWYFNGRQNVRALFNMLRQRYGLDDTNAATRVALAGTSAGGVGVFAATELVKGLLPRSTASGRVKLILDGAWEPEWNDPVYVIKNAPSGTSDLDVMNHKTSFYKSRLLSGCEEQYPSERGRCMMLGFVYPHLVALGLPVFVQSSSRDKNITREVHGISLDDADGSLSRWKELMLQEFAMAPYTWQFSPDTFYHTITTKNGSSGWEMPFEATGDTYRAMVHRFWDDDYSDETRRITP